MSSNLEIVGRVLSRYSAQDIDGMLEDVHPEVEIDYSESNAPDPTVYHGHAACRAFAQSRYEDFDERSLDVVELIDAPPNAVVAVGRMRGKGRASGVAVEREFGRLKNEWALAPLPVRGLDRVRLHADLTILAKLACALASYQAASHAAA